MHILGSINMPATPSGALVSSYLNRAHDDMMANEPEYRLFSEGCAHALSARRLMALICDEDGPLAVRLRAHPMFLSALQLMKVSGRRRGGGRDPLEWALFRGHDPEECDNVAADVLKDPVGLLANRMERTFYPADVGVFLKMYFVEKMVGNLAHARNLYEEALEKGLPLPGGLVAL